MTRETLQTKAIIGSWRWKYRGQPVVRQMPISLTPQEWDDLKLLATERCRKPEAVVGAWAKQHIAKWRQS